MSDGIVPASAPVMKKQRNREKQTLSLEERLRQDTERLRERLKALPHDAASRLRIMRRIEQNEAALAMSEWLAQKSS